MQDQSRCALALNRLNLQNLNHGAVAEPDVQGRVIHFRQIVLQADGMSQETC